MPDEKNIVHTWSNLRDLYDTGLCGLTGSSWGEGEGGFGAEIPHRILSQITLFSHSISHSFPNELNGLRAESHLFKPDEVGQKIDLPGGLICAHAKLDSCFEPFFFNPASFYWVTVVLTQWKEFCVRHSHIQNDNEDAQQRFFNLQNEVLLYRTQKRTNNLTL